MLLYSEGATKGQQDEAEQILGLLCVAYPGHPWAVRVDKGFIFIRHLAFPGNWGMNLKTREADHDAAVLKKKIVMLAGEWLERAGLVRGPENGDEIIRVEGVPDKFQPPSQKAPLEAEQIVFNPDEHPLRTKPRPQVKGYG